MATVVAFPDECVSAAQAVKSGKSMFCVFVTEGNGVEIHEMGERKIENGKKDKEQCAEEWRTFTNQLPKGRCAYGLANFSYISPTDQIERNKVVFVLWAPGSIFSKWRKEKLGIHFSSSHNTSSFLLVDDVFW